MTIQPSDPTLLTDRDVEYACFGCCGDEDLVFLRCLACGHLMVFCYECDTLYPDLTAPAVRHAFSRASPTSCVQCPACDVPFAHLYFLQSAHVDHYLPTVAQVRAAGFGHLLASHLREH